LKKIDLGQTITILANVGVIAGIIFLGIEIQQNTVSSRVNAYQDLTGRIMDFVGEGGERYQPGYQPSREAFEQLSDTEQRRLRGVVVSRFRFGDLAFYQYEMGMLTEERFESLMRPITNEICKWPFPDVWSGARSNFVSSYSSYIDVHVSRC